MKKPMKIITGIVTILALSLIIVILFFNAEERLYNFAQFETPLEKNYGHDFVYSYSPNVARIHRDRLEVDNFIFDYPNSMPWIEWYSQKSFSLNGEEYSLAMISLPPNLNPEKSGIQKTQFYIKFPLNTDLDRLNSEDIVIQNSNNGSTYNDYTIEKITEYNSLLITLFQSGLGSTHQMTMSIPLPLKRSSYALKRNIEFVFAYHIADYGFVGQLKPLYQNDLLIRMLFAFYGIPVEKAFQVMENPNIDIVDLTEN